MNGLFVCYWSGHGLPPFYKALMLLGSMGLVDHSGMLVGLQFRQVHSQFSNFSTCLFSF